jgi:hypothetical protein
MDDPKYVELLKDLAYHNLDEGGNQVDAKNIVDGGAHSIARIQGERKAKYHLNMTMGKVPEDHCFLDESTLPLQNVENRM